MTAPAELVPPVRERRLAFYWRFAATGVSFLTFAVGTLLVGLVLLPAVRLAPAAPTVRRARARTVIQWWLRTFIGVMHGLRTMTYELRGVERLGRPGQLIVANHPTLIDMLFLLAFTRGANCVVKHGLWRNPVTRSTVRLAEYLSNASALEMTGGACAALKDGQTLVMFPEGTRTNPGASPVFQRGAAHIALRAARTVTPVYIRCEPATLSKSVPWSRIPRRRPHFLLIVGEDLDLRAFRDAPLPQVSRRFNEHLQANFRAALGE